MAQKPKPAFTVRLNRTLVLVGLMGAGKTSVGRRLAAFLDVPFWDSDYEIEQAAGRAVRDIFEELGEPSFRDGERKVVARLLSQEPGVLATGGGAFMAPEVREIVAEKGLSIWLDGDLETLWDRVRDKPTRPLLQQPNPKSILRGLLNERRATYALADIRVVSETGLAHELMVRRILEGVRAHDIAHPDRLATLTKEPVDAAENP